MVQRKMIIALLVGALVFGCAPQAPQGGQGGQGQAAQAPRPSTTAVATSAAGPTISPTGPRPAPASPGAATPAPATAAPTPTALAVAAVARTGSGVLVDDDFSLLHGQRVGLIAHRASVVDGRRLADLLSEHPEVELTALFAPEHGIFGAEGAGEQIADGVDDVTGVPVFTLYGDTRAPTIASLSEVDVLVYDLQDIGARFYTYISTLGLAMQSAAQADIDFVVLDRPNPLGSGYLGPTLEVGLESFVGLYQIPSAYGLTAGELALTIVDQQLLGGLEGLRLQVVAVEGWDRGLRWDASGLVWIPPSPNILSMDAALLYPGMVLFEATSISEGRGTSAPFQLIGAGWIDGEKLAESMRNLNLAGVSFAAASFTPTSRPGSPSPRYEGQLLSGVQVGVEDPSIVDGLRTGLALLDAILDQAATLGRNRGDVIDRVATFDRLAGSVEIRACLLADCSIDGLMASFATDHAAWREQTRASLLYGSPD